MVSRRNGRKKSEPIAATPAPPAPELPRRGQRWLAVGFAGLILALAGGVFLYMRQGSLPGIGGSSDPDVILITIDTLRTDGVSFTGSKRVKTPFLDELASKGVYFENAHAHNVVTLPSHTNILTGLLPYQHGVRDNAGFTLKPQHSTLARALKERGYSTGAFVASYPLDARFGLDPSFDVYDDKYPEGSAPSAFVVPERPAAEVFAAARQWWDTLGSKKRFMWVHIYDPHVPYEPPSPFREQYPDSPYYGEVAAADDALGKFLRPILENGRETMVVLTSDHGEGMGEHEEVTHGLFAYEETLHVPLIVYEKGRVKPAREKKFVRHIDIVPTIFARLGIEQPKELTGRSLLDIKEPRDTYFESLTASLNLGWAPLIGMIHDGHKYIELPLPELYDLSNDPLEKRNTFSENRRMTTRIRELLVQSAPSNEQVKRSDVSAEDAKSLMALGYLTGTAAARKAYTADDDPKNLVHFYSRMNHAVALYQKGEWSEAIAVAQKLLTDRPEMTLARDLLAFVLQQTEQPEKAEKLLREAIAGGKASDTMKKRLGLLLSEKGEAAEAVEILSQFENAQDPELHNAYGIALADLGRVQEAVRQFERALAIDATNALAFQNLGVVALRNGNIDRAQHFLSRALQLNPKMPLALNTIGVVFAQRRDYPRAIDAWQRAVAIDPRQFDALFNIGLISLQSGDKKGARHALTRFIETAPPQRYAADIAKAKRALSSM